MEKNFLYGRTAVCGRELFGVGGVGNIGNYWGQEQIEHRKVNRWRKHSYLSPQFP